MRIENTQGGSTLLPQYETQALRFPLAEATGTRGSAIGFYLI